MFCSGAAFTLAVAAGARWPSRYRTIWHVVYEASGRTSDGWRVTKFHAQVWGGRTTIALTEYTATTPEMAERAARLWPAGRRLRRSPGTKLGLGAGNQPWHPLNVIGVRPYHRVRDDGGGSRYEEWSVSLPSWMAIPVGAAVPAGFLALRLTGAPWRVPGRL